MCQQSISYRGSTYWNKVPNSLKNKKQSLGSFCKNFLQICVQMHEVIDYFSINSKANLNIVVRNYFIEIYLRKTNGFMGTDCAQATIP